MAALDEFPTVVLGDAVFVFFEWVPADGCGVKQYLCALQRREARGFGIPLIPADEDADFRVGGVPGAEAGVAGGEVKLFVEERIVGDVHFAVNAFDAPVGFDDDGGVVIKPGGALFEKACDDDDFIFFGELAEQVGARAGDGFGEFEKAVVFGLAKIKTAEQFLRADDFRPFLGGLFDELRLLGAVDGWVFGAGHLRDADRDDAFGY